MRVDEVDYDLIVNQVRHWVNESASCYFCSSTVHMVMESYDDPTFQAVVNGADLVGTDGAPIVWVSRWLGLDRQTCVFAWEVTTRLCEMADQERIPVGFYGSTPEVIQDVVENLKGRFATLNVAYAFSPPFRPLTSKEDEAIVDDIKRSGIRILFVGLGCPKQERWMSEHRGRIPATMLGVGWAFDVLAGRSKVAPGWIQKIGMQWLYRVVSNPKKLWRRYLKTNPRFALLILRQLWNVKSAARPPQYSSSE
jgi:N-acetylglucosaminyldiphosphoundecaprenol N-acetyl-beta-D-mannosaminyltransferase